MTAGALQTLLKSSGLVAEGRLVLAGTGPLLWLLAAQLLRAAASITALLDTTPAPQLSARAAPCSGIRRSRLTLPRAWLCGARWRARCRSCAASRSCAPRATARCAAVVYVAGSGREQRIATDVLALHQGVVPNVNLAMAAGIAHRWDAGAALLGAGARCGRQHRPRRHRHCRRRRRHRRGGRGRDARPSRRLGRGARRSRPEHAARLPDRQVLAQALARAETRPGLPRPPVRAATAIPHARGSTPSPAAARR